jgi:putative ABC transport system ATP-binding protein
MVIVESRTSAGLSARQGRGRAVRGSVSLDRKRGFHLHCRPSGSGKTTILILLGCVDRPTFGDCNHRRLATKDLSDKQLTSLRHGDTRVYLQYRSTCFPSSRCTRTSSFPFFRQGGPKGEDRSLLDRLPDRGKSVSVSGKTPNPTSFRAASASVSPSRAPWFNKPQIVLADEPTANLDSATVS